MFPFHKKKETRRSVVTDRFSSEPPIPHPPPQKKKCFIVVDSIGQQLHLPSTVFCRERERERERRFRRWEASQLPRFNCLPASVGGVGVGVGLRVGVVDDDAGGEITRRRCAADSWPAIKTVSERERERVREREREMRKRRSVYRMLIDCGRSFFFLRPAGGAGQVINRQWRQ